MTLNPTLAMSDNGDGTGGVATVTASSPGSTNTLYLAAYGYGAMPWITGSSCTGNGTIATAHQGSYFCEVRSVLAGTEATSNAYLISLTTGPVSVIDTIVDQTVLALQGLGLTFNGSPVPVVDPKIPRNLNLVDPTPQITVAGEPMIDEAVWFAFDAPSGGVVQMTYNIKITIVALAQFDYVSNLPTYRYWREQIRTLFGGALTIYSDPVWNFDITMGEFEDRGQFENDYDVQMMTIKVITAEAGMQ